MAKVIVLKSVFDTSDFEECELEENKTVEQFLDDIGMTEPKSANMVEIYDAETGETYFESEDDAGANELLVNIVVNKEEQEKDYVIQKDDIVFITILPASKKGIATALTVIGGIALTAALVASMALSGGLTTVWGLSATGWIGIGLGGAALLGIGALWLLSMEEKEENKGIKNDDADKNPTIAGTQNQPLGSNTFPHVFGTVECSPFVIGSPYNEFVYSENFDRTWLGYTQTQTLLLLVGYSPLYIDNIKLENLPLSRNPNKIFSGLITESNAEGQSFNGKSLEKGEVGSTWNKNDFEIEISQFGEHRTLYPYVVKQMKVDAVSLYCYDKKYQTVAGDVITWQGGAYPTGLRTNTIKFSEALPYKVSVTIDMPSGLYRHHVDDSDHYYEKIPMDFAIQWRPVYKIMDRLDLHNDGEGSLSYLNKRLKQDGSVDPSFEPEYDETRYTLWRNFDENKIVRKVKYNQSKLVYYTYKINDKYIVYNGNVGYFVSRYGYITDLNNLPADAKWTSIGKYNLSKKELQKREVERERSRWTLKSVQQGSTNAWATYIRDDGRTFSESGSGWSNRFNDMIAIQAALVVKQYKNDMNGYWTLMTAGCKNVTQVDSSTSVISSISQNEVNANYGLSEGTSTDCNPNWTGVDVFTFGKYSCGEDAYRSDSYEPAINNKSKSFKNIEHAKDQMTFEISAELTQEDILDLLNLNPKTNKLMSDLGTDDYKVVTDCIQVRVIRLTPCYINKKKNDYDYDYSDITKWTVMKTFCLDKNKLIKDITTKQIDRDGNEETYSKINADFHTLGEKNPDGYTWNDWDINEYRATPLDDEDQRKVCTLAIKCKADKLGYVSNSLKRVSLRARAITPSMKEGFIRYWHTVDDKHYYYDSYDNVTVVINFNEAEDKEKFKEEQQVITPVFNINEWTLDCDDEYASAEKYPYYGTDIEYEVKNNDWDKVFFPKVIETKKEAEYKVDSDNYIVKDPDLRIELVRRGNTWLDYISNEMKRNRDTLGRWRATDAFLETFTGQNSIAQLLGLMVGSALGQDAKCYNSTPARRLIRLWTIKEVYVEKEGERVLFERYYLYFDTKAVKFSDVEEIPEIPVDMNDIGEWSIGSYHEFAREHTTETAEGSNIYWSFRVLDDDFNMQTVKESYSYTNQIDLGQGPLKWKYNQYLYTATKLETLMGQILAAALGYWTYDELGRYEFINDRPLFNPVLMITDENCLSSSFTRKFDKGIAGYHVTFNDENNAFATGEIYALMNGQSKEHHTKDIMELNLTGFTNGVQVQTYAFYMLAQTMLQKELWTLKLNHLGHFLKIGSLINVQSLTMMIGTDNSGRIIKLIEDDDYIYGFIIDNIYDYRCEYSEGKNIQGCQIMQSEAQDKDRIITVRMANEEQQSYGLTVTERGQTITYRNLKGQTNCVLLEKKIIKNKKRLENQDVLAEEEDLEITNVTNFMPAVGDVVAFGNVGHITSKCVVIGLTYDEKNNVTIECYPYNEGLYTCCATMPQFISNITKKSRTADVPLKETVSPMELEEAVNDAKVSVKKDMSVGDVPEVPEITAKATRDYIELNYSINDSITRNSITNIEWIIIKDKNTRITLSSSGNTKYFFNRDTDGYPEADEISGWEVQAFVTNIWGKTTEEPAETTISTIGYGTWLVNQPTVMTRVSDRTITLLITQPTMSNLKELYGNVRYKISVKRFDDNQFYCPATTADPYANENNYKDTKAAQNYLISNNVYTQCMSLRNTDSEGHDIGLVDTHYEFKVIAFNECSEATPLIVGEDALCTSIRDIVKANETAKQAYISNLAAISADLGVIKSGSMTGNDNNYWALSDIAAEEGHRQFKQGEFRVGSDTQYIQFDPVRNKMDIKADIEIEGDFANIRGELAVYPVKDEYKLSTDTQIVEGKNYYTRSGTDPNYIYTFVAEPVLAELLAGLYYEKISGSESGLKPALQVLPNEANPKKNQTTINGNFAAKDNSTFGTSTVDENFIRQFLEINDTVRLNITY